MSEDLTFQQTLFFLFYFSPWPNLKNLSRVQNASHESLSVRIVEEDRKLRVRENIWKNE